MSTLKKLGILLFGAVVGIAGTIAFTVLTSGNNASASKEKAAEITEQAAKSEADVESLESELQDLEAAYKTLKTESGEEGVSALEKASETLFDVYYNYEQETITSEERREAVKDVVTPEIAEKLFPKSFDEQTSDFGAIRSKLNGTTVYIEKTDGNTLTALVDVDYTVAAGDMSNDIPHYAFKVTFDKESERITDVEDFGKIGK